VRSSVVPSASSACATAQRVSTRNSRRRRVRDGAPQRLQRPSQAACSLAALWAAVRVRSAGDSPRVRGAWAQPLASKFLTRSAYVSTSACAPSRSACALARSTWQRARLRRERRTLGLRHAASACQDERKSHLQPILDKALVVRHLGTPFMSRGRRGHRRAAAPPSLHSAIRGVAKWQRTRSATHHCCALLSSAALASAPCCCGIKLACS
jgi:hypothetical protein